MHRSVAVWEICYASVCGSHECCDAQWPRASENAAKKIQKGATHTCWHHGLSSVSLKISNRPVLTNNHYKQSMVLTNFSVNFKLYINALKTVCLFLMFCFMPLFLDCYSNMFSAFRLFYSFNFTSVTLIVWTVDLYLYTAVSNRI